MGDGFGWDGPEHAARDITAGMAGRTPDEVLAHDIAAKVKAVL
jgi:hypothetical protein